MVTAKETQASVNILPSKGPIAVDTGAVAFVRLDYAEQIHLEALPLTILSLSPTMGSRLVLRSRPCIRRGLDHQHLGVHNPRWRILERDLD
jgi:hypothetical protein